MLDYIFTMNIFIMELNQNKIKSVRPIKITRVIPHAYKRSLELTKYLIGVSQPKYASQIISTLKQLQHENDKQINKGDEKQIQQNLLKQEKQKYFLKRVRKNQNNKIQVILCRENNQNKDIIRAKITKFQFIEKIQEIQLPTQPPLTKDQYQQWSKFWPINFVLQQIAKQIPHTQQSINFIANLTNQEVKEEDYYLIDSKCQNILLTEKGQCKQQSIDHPIMRLLQKWPLSQQFSSKPEKYYYLTGLKLFTRKQLCGMCSMALIHSRLHSIYLKLKPTETMDKIMGCPKLNHQIIMFQISIA